MDYSKLIMRVSGAWPYVTGGALLGTLLAVVLLAIWGGVPVMYNVRNLAVRWRTSVMTALAFTLVTALLTVMLSFVNGMYSLTQKSGHPENLLILGQGVQDEVFSSLAFNDTADMVTQPGIARTTSDPPEPLVSKETYLNVNQPVNHPQPGGPKRRFLQVRGLDDPKISVVVHGVTLYEGGRLFTEAGSRARAADDGSKQPLIEVVIGEGLARTLGSDRTAEERQAARDPKRLTVDDTFAVGNRECVIVGVMQSAGYTYDSEIWAKRSIMAEEFGKRIYTTFVVKAESEQAARGLKEFFAEKYKKASVEPLLETEYFEKLSGNNRQFLVAVIFVAVVLAIGGIFGVMNTMYAAIAQRTKDIGVLRLVGFGGLQVLLSFVLESLLIALIGGAVGCMLGSIAHGTTVSSMVGTGQGGGKSVVIKMVVDWLVLGQGMLLAVVMGALGGFVPALSAVRLKPLESLR